MKATVSECDFIRAFEDCNRKENFSHAGLAALYEYLTDLESDCGIEIELDVIALCCEYSEYTIEEALRDYNIIDSCGHCGEGLSVENLIDGINCPDCGQTVLDIDDAEKWVSHRTTFIKINDDSFIIACF